MSKEYTWINFDMNELFGELMDLVHGDMWDGMMSKHHEKEYRECYRIFQERLDKLQRENERLRAALDAADSLIFCFATRPLDIRDTLSKMNWDKAIAAKSKMYSEAKDKLKSQSNE